VPEFTGAGMKPACSAWGGTLAVAEASLPVPPRASGVALSFLTTTGFEPLPLRGETRVDARTSARRAERA
jgi:hypothetical protein